MDRAAAEGTCLNRLLECDVLDERMRRLSADYYKISER